MNVDYELGFEEGFKKGKSIREANRKKKLKKALWFIPFLWKRNSNRNNWVLQLFSMEKRKAFLSFKWF